MSLLAQFIAGAENFLRENIFIEVLLLSILFIALLILYIRNKINIHYVLKRYSLLSHISREFRKPFDRKKIFSSVSEQITKVIPSIKGFVLVLYGPQGKKDIFRLTKNINKEDIERIALSRSLKNSLKDNGILKIKYPRIRNIKGAPYKNLTFFPIIVKGHLVGIAGILTRKEKIARLDEVLLRVAMDQLSVEFSGRLLQRKLDEYSKGLSLVEYSYESIVENLPNGVVAIDTQRRILLYNEKMQEYLNLKSPIGKDYFSAWSRTGALGKIRDFVEVMQEQEDLTHLNHVEFRKGGKKRIIDIDGYPLFDMQNEVIAYIIIHEDITQQYELQQQLNTSQKEQKAELEKKVRVATSELISANKELVRLNKLKTEFVSVISHELKTPMTSIKGYVSLLLSGKMGELSQQQRKSLAIVASESDRLAQLINDVLDLSRLESGKTTLKLEESTMTDIIKQSIKLLQPQANNKKIRITFAPAKTQQPLWIDTAKMKQVVLNLLSNAIKFTPDKGKISISVLHKRSLSQIVIKDTGIGINKQDQKHLFDPFYQVEDHLTRNSKGTGLGLTICKHIVQLHKGSIHVDSTLNKGTTITVSIPRHLDRE